MPSAALAHYGSGGAGSYAKPVILHAPCFSESSAGPAEPSPKPKLVRVSFWHFSSSIIQASMPDGRHESRIATRAIGGYVGDLRSPALLIMVVVTLAYVLFMR